MLDKQKKNVASDKKDSKKIIISSNFCHIPDPLNTDGADRPLNSITGIVLHHTATKTLKPALDELRRNGLGYGFIIDTNGAIIKTGVIDKVAYHAMGANNDTIGIAFVGSGINGWTPNLDQEKSLLKLITELKKKYPNIKYLLNHGDISPDTKVEELRTINTDKIIEELKSSNIQLYHPNSEQEPLKSYRKNEQASRAINKSTAKQTFPNRVNGTEKILCSNPNYRPYENKSTISVK